jgi:ABC-2 type transport system permease protein
MIGFSPARILAVVLRNLYVMKGSWPRLLEMAYWPALQVLVWGFTSQFFMTNSSYIAQAAGILISAVLLWDIVMRAQLGVSISCMEEMWSRNLGHLFVSPLRPYEWLLSLMVMSVIRTLIGVAPATLIAWLAYHFSLFSLGLPLIAFFTALLVMGWSVGIMSASLVLRYGLGAETLAWVAPFALAPISAIYYPVTALPPWLRPIAEALPSTQVFEGMRAVMIDGVFRWDLLAKAYALDALYLALSGGVFVIAFASARVRGKLLQVGE